MMQWSVFASPGARHGHFPKKERHEIAFAWRESRDKLIKASRLMGTQEAHGQKVMQHHMHVIIMASQLMNLNLLKQQMLRGIALETMIRDNHFFKFPNSPYYHVRLYNFDNERITLTTRSKDLDTAKQKLPNILMQRFFAIRLSDLIAERHNITIRKSKGTVLCEEQALIHFQRLVGDLTVTDITPTHAKWFMEQHVDRNGEIVKWNSAASPAKHHRHLHAIWNDLIFDRKLPDDGNIWNFDPPSFAKIIQFAPSEQQLRDLVDWIDQLPAKPIILNKDFFRRMIIIGSRTGMRISELLNIRMKWLDLDEQRILVSNERDFNLKGKPHRIRRIPFDLFTAQILNDQIEASEKRLARKMQPDDPLFVDFCGQRIKYSAVRTAVDGVAIVNLPDFTMHSLRRYFARAFWNATEDKMQALLDLQRVMGHASLKSTLEYLAESIGTDERVLANLEKQAQAWNNRTKG